MKDLIIIGAGDFGREVSWLVERINAQTPEWNLLGFADDGKAGERVDGYPVLGDVYWLENYPDTVYVTCAIANGAVKEAIWRRLEKNRKVRAATLIDPAALIGRNCTVGEGSIICAGTVLTVNCRLGRSCIVNLNCTVGHDTVLEDYCTVHPGANISGKVQLGRRCLLGTGTKLIQGLRIAPDTVFGAGAVVVKNIEEAGTYAGVPAGKIK